MAMGTTSMPVECVIVSLTAEIRHPAGVRIASSS